MWAFCVSVGAPSLDDHLGFPEAVEDFAIKAFISRIAVEGRTVAILPRRSGFNTKVPGTKPCQPFVQDFGDHFGPVI